MKRNFLTEKELRSIAPGSPCYVEKGTHVTPLALEMAAQRGNAIIECDSPEEINRLKAYNQRLALGAAEQGGGLLQKIKLLLQDNDYLVCECGTDQTEEDPGGILGVAHFVQTGQACRGIWLDRDGIGSCILANKCPGIRAAHCYDRLTARISRERHGANILVLAEPLLDADLATLIVTTWLHTPFAGDRHRRQAARVEEVEKKFLRETVVAIPGDCSCAL